MSVVMSDWIPRHRISVDEYYKMAEVGLLAPDARVELIEGEIIDMPPIGSPHAGTVQLIHRQLSRAVGDLAHVFCQSPVRLSIFSEPVPDLALLKPRSDFYRRGHPIAVDALLIVEVSVTSLRYDLQVKVPLYARHEVPEVWIVDLEGKQLRVFRTPKSGEYTDVASRDNPGVITPCALDAAQIDLSGVFDD
jgi:Uma2 family endonuclease